MERGRLPWSRPRSSSECRARTVAAAADVGAGDEQTAGQVAKAHKAAIPTTTTKKAWKSGSIGSTPADAKMECRAAVSARERWRLVTRGRESSAV